jgi:hypothetical protein
VPDRPSSGGGGTQCPPAHRFHHFIGRIVSSFHWAHRFVRRESWRMSKSAGNDRAFRGVRRTILDKSKIGPIGRRTPESADALLCAVPRRLSSVGANPTRQLSLQPVAIGAAVEVTKLSKPSMQRAASGGSASRQAVTRVNAEQASKHLMWVPTRQWYGEGRCHGFQGSEPIPLVVPPG